MSELVYRQPSAESFTYLDPQFRRDHLIAVFDCSKKVPKYDEKAKCEKDHATFRAVDLDGERELITFADNHDGIVRDINPGDVGVLIGRITTIKTKAGNDFFVLGEHTAEDTKRVDEWYEDFKAGKNTATGWQSPRVATNGNGQIAAVKTPTPTLPAATATPTPAATPATTGEFDLTKLDPATLALILNQVQAKATP